MKDPMRRAMDFISKVVQDPDAYPDGFIALPRDPAVLGQVFARGRLEIMDYLERYGPVARMQDLADALGRDKAAVSRDVKLLVGWGLVREERVGRRKELWASGVPVVVW